MLIARSLAASAVVLAAGLLGAGPAAADTVPFDDSAAAGRLTLCDVRGDVATSGSVYTKPFVWRAVGSSPGSGAYASQGRTATLYGYQPIKDVDPSQWVGDYLTGSARYSNAARPMAAATAADRSLHDLLLAYPPKWDGMVQLRVFLSAPGQPGLTDDYNAATIRVTGDRWTLLSGGRTGCDSGTSLSNEDILLPHVRKLGTPAPDATTTGPAASPAGAGGGARGTTSPTPGGSLPGRGSSPTDARGHAQSDATSASAVANSTRSSGGGAVWLWSVGALVVVAGGAVALRRRLASLRPKH